MCLGSLVAPLAMAVIAGLRHGHGPGAVLVWRVSAILAAIAAGVLVTGHALQSTVVQPQPAPREADRAALLP